MSRSALLIIVPLLAACDVHSKNPASGDDNVTIQADADGQIAFNMPFAEGRIKVPAGVMHGGDVDIDGVKLMPGSSITGFNLNAADDRSTVRMNFSSTAKPEDVLAYYADRFGKSGTDISVAANSVTGKTKDGSAFVIRVTPASNGSQGTIEIQDRA